MMTDQLRILLIIAVLCYFGVILKLLKDKALSLKYTLLWLFSGVVLGLMVLFPSTLAYIIHRFGIYSEMNGLIFLCIGFLIIICIALTSIVTRQNKKIRVLIQEVAIMEKRLREMENEKE